MSIALYWLTTGEMASNSALDWRSAFSMWLPDCEGKWERTSLGAAYSWKKCWFL